eukprot:1224795-Pyramimonas_sp.AAC.1
MAQNGVRHASKRPREGVGTPSGSPQDAPIIPEPGEHRLWLYPRPFACDAQLKPQDDAIEGPSWAQRAPRRLQERPTAPQEASLRASESGPR